MFSLVWLIAGAAGPQGLEADAKGEELVLAGHFGGPAMATAAYGDFALMGYSFEFAVIDVSDPAQPRRVAYLMLPSNDIQVAGDVAYVAGRGVLNLVSLENPLQPHVAGSAVFDGAATGLAVTEDTAYVTAPSGLYIFDVRRSRRPALRAWLPLPGRCEGVAADGGHAYVTGSAGLHVVDVAQTSKPVLVTSLPTNGYAESAALDRGLLYRGGWRRGVDGGRRLCATAAGSGRRCAHAGLRRGRERGERARVCGRRPGGRAGG